MGTSRLTILFDDPFWIGLYEREDDTEYSVCRIVFGAEPRDQEVYAYLLEHWRTLRFSPPRPGTEHLPPPKSPKRRQREARRMTQAAGIGTKAQQALKLQQEQGKSRPHPPTAGGGGSAEVPAAAGASKGKAQRSLTSVLFSGTVFIRGLRRRQTLL